MSNRIARSLIGFLCALMVLGAGAADALAFGHSDWTQADHFGLPTEQPQYTLRAGESFQIAKQFWGGAELPCTDARVYVASQAQMAAATGNGAAVGATDWCSLWVVDELVAERTWYARIRTCSIIVHEYGHALRVYGAGHSTQRGSIMYPDFQPNEVVYACYRRFLPQGQGRAFRKMVGKPLFLHR